VRAESVARITSSSREEWTSMSMQVPHLMPPLPCYRRHNRAVLERRTVRKALLSKYRQGARLRRAVDFWNTHWSTLTHSTFAQQKKNRKYRSPRGMRGPSAGRSHLKGSRRTALAIGNVTQTRSHAVFAGPPCCPETGAKPRVRTHRGPLAAPRYRQTCTYTGLGQLPLVT
jgi:hypothetical protein